MNKNTLIVGFTLFAIFFGAGNLIFPPKLGLESGAEFWPSIFGFIVSGVGLPLLGIIVSAFYEGGYKNALNRVHPWFSIAFLMAIYLSIGPFFAIPRTAATSYEIAVLPFIGTSSTTSLLIFTLIYFALSLWFALNPSKTVERVGAILTPILLLSILLLVVKSFFLLSNNEPVILDMPPKTGVESFFNGIISGYLTMDALASLAFSVIVISAIKAKGVKSEQTLTKQIILSGIIAAIALGAVYLSIGWIGNHVSISNETLATLNENKQDIGTYILNSVATLAFGEFGRSILGLIVSLACLTTAIGLIVSVSEYFNEIYHKISYKTYAIFFTLISLLISNQGLSAVISKSVPVLLVLYPIAMTIILLLLLNLFIKLPTIALRISVGLTTLISIASVAGLPFTESLPLKSYSLEWISFAVAGLLIGYIINLLSKTK